MDCFQQQVFCRYHTDEQPAGNVLFLAVYLFSHKDLRSKIEQNVVISLLLYVQANLGTTPYHLLRRS